MAKKVSKDSKRRPGLGKGDKAIPKKCRDCELERVRVEKKGDENSEQCLEAERTSKGSEIPEKKRIPKLIRA